MRIHPTFHVYRIKPAQERPLIPCVSPPPPSPSACMVDMGPFYSVQCPLQLYPDMEWVASPEYWTACFFLHRFWDISRPLVGGFCHSLLPDEHQYVHFSLNASSAHNCAQQSALTPLTCLFSSPTHSHPCQIALLLSQDSQGSFRLPSLKLSKSLFDVFVFFQEKAGAFFLKDILLCHVRLSARKMYS